jgi:hypothetical protein
METWLPGLLILIVVMFAGVPIAMAMAAVGGLGLAAMLGIGPALAIVGQTTFDAGLSYSLSVVPLFIFMGNVLVTRSGVSHGLYAVCQCTATARMRGGLAMASVIACGGFSAVCGSSLATAATMSKVAMPSMRKYGYADSLAAGSIAAGGTLGILIPPSVILIIYGLLTESDIGKLFIAGVVPGILGLLLYLVAVQVAVWRKPELAPPATDLEPLTTRDALGVIALLLHLRHHHGRDLRRLLHAHRGRRYRRRRLGADLRRLRPAGFSRAWRGDRRKRKGDRDDLRADHRRRHLHQFRKFRRPSGCAVGLRLRPRPQPVAGDSRHHRRLSAARLRAGKPVDDPPHRAGVLSAW